MDIHAYYLHMYVYSSLFKKKQKCLGKVLDIRDTSQLWMREMFVQLRTAKQCVFSLQKEYEL